MAYKLVKTEGGKTNWALIRHIGYCVLFAWAIGVRLMRVDPFDDIMSGQITIGTLLDIAVLWVIGMIAWFVLYPARPRWNSTT